MGTAVAQWLRCCATIRKVAGSILKRSLDLGLRRSLLGIQDAKHLKMTATVNHAGGPDRKWRSGCGKLQMEVNSLYNPP